MGSQPVAVTFSDCGSDSRCPLGAEGSFNPPGAAASPRSCQGRKQMGAGPLALSPNSARLEVWARDDHAGPGAQGKFHVLALVDEEHPTPAARAPKNCAFLCLHLSSQSSPAPPLPFECSCTGCAAPHRRSQQPQVHFRLSAHFCTA